MAVMLMGAPLTCNFQVAYSKDLVAPEVQLETVYLDLATRASPLVCMFVV